MIKLPLISVIVPIYKVEDYLSFCLESILLQTYDNLEIILVNDGSPDNCGAICEEYAAKDNRIIVVQKENGGLSDARNAGINICKGEYLALVDSDDAIHPQFIEHLYLAIGENKMSFCQYSKFVSENDTHEFIEAFIPFNKSLIGEYNAVELNIHLGISNEFTIEHVVAWNKLYRRDVFDSLRYKKGAIHEDEFIIHKIYNLSNKVSYVREQLYFYRIRETSIVNDVKNKNNKRNIMNEVYRERIAFFASTNLSALLYTKYKLLLLNKGDYKMSSADFVSLIRSRRLNFKNKLIVTVYFLKSLFV